MIRPLAVALAIAGATLPALAQDGAIRPLWLSEGAEIGRLPATRPDLLPPIEARTPQWRLGELAFRAPAILGGEARRAGLSCNACHPGGGAHTGFFIPGLSGAPGTVDVTHAAWNPAAEDHIPNPVRIPPLWGIADSAPFGFRGQFKDLGAFIGNVIEVEFAGPRPAPAILNALTAYVAALPRPEGGGKGDGRGREAFEKGCGGCHRPEADYQDGKVHGGLNTASLRTLGSVTRYFHDARASDLSAAIREHARGFGITHGTETLQSLTEHVRAIGGPAPRAVAITAAEDIDRIAGAVTVLLAGPEPVEPALVAALLQGEVGDIHARLTGHPPEQAMLEDWASDLRALRALAEDGKAEAMRTAATALAARIGRERPAIETAAGTSAYRPGR